MGQGIHVTEICCAMTLTREISIFLSSGFQQLFSSNAICPHYTGQSSVEEIIINDLETLNWKQRDVLNLTSNKTHQYNKNN